MTSENTFSMQIIPYRYKVSLLVAIIFPCLTLVVLRGSAGGHTLFSYLVPLLVGGLTGYLAGYLLEDGQRSLQLAMTINCTVEKKIQDRKAHEAWYAALFDKNQAVLLLINPATGLIEKANSSACEFYGYTDEEFRQLHISELDTLTNKKIDSTDELPKVEGKQKMCTRHKMASGEERDVELIAGSIVIDSTPLLFLVVDDITEQKTLRGIIPICSHCKQIRSSGGEWNQMEEFIQLRSEARFSHGLCPICAERHYPTIYQNLNK